MSMIFKIRHQQNVTQVEHCGGNVQLSLIPDLRLFETYNLFPSASQGLDETANYKTREMVSQVSVH